MNRMQRALTECSDSLREAAFVLESLAHLRGQEAELLPLAAKVREVSNQLKAEADGTLPARNELERVSGRRKGE